MWSQQNRMSNQGQDKTRRARGINSLWTPFLYLFAFRSNMVYLSLGLISSSLGISESHLSTVGSVCPCLASALLTVSTTESTPRMRRRCLLFWNLDMRHGIFHKRPLLNGFVIRNGPNMVPLCVFARAHRSKALAGSRCRGVCVCVYECMIAAGLDEAEGRRAIRNLDYQ